MRKLVILVLAAVILAAMLAGGCAKPAPSPAPTPTPAPAPPKTLDIGVAVVLTGVTAHIGTNIQNAILMAIDDRNEQGGVTIAGQKYVLNPIVRDTKQDIIAAKSIAEELVFDKGVKVISGPFIADAVGVQSVTEPNKVMLFGISVVVPAMIGPNKPYTFFSGRPKRQMLNNPCAYIQKFYPEAKTVISLIPDISDLPTFTDAAETMCQRYGLDWQGYEKMPIDTKDFMPIISRVLPKNPDIIDTSSTGGAMGAMCALLVKQLRQAGFNGIIMIPAVPPPGLIEEVVPKEYLTKVVTNDLNPDGPVVTQAYRDICNGYEKKFGQVPVDIVAWVYNCQSAFYKFLDGQTIMDTTAWMEGFEKYRWQGPFGFESFWIGKPIWGIDRCLLGPAWTSEYKNGKLVTEWAAPLPYDMFVGK